MPLPYSSLLVSPPQELARYLITLLLLLDDYRTVDLSRTVFFDEEDLAYALTLTLLCIIWYPYHPSWW